MTARWGVAALLLAAAPAAAAGQGLGERVRAVESGVAVFGFPARAGVEVCEEGVRVGERRAMWRVEAWGGPDGRRCVVGSVTVALEVEGGRVVDVEVVRPGDEPSGEAEDLGRVEGEEAARYLLGLARGTASERGAREAIFPATLADAPDSWRGVLELARDRDVAHGVRKNALFWLGQVAADAATEGLAEVAGDDEETQELRDAAIFALSQRPGDEGVPLLMELARTADQPRTRRTAMFWLAQSGDERVAPFFERVLLGRPR